MHSLDKSILVFLYFQEGGVGNSTSLGCLWDVYNCLEGLTAETIEQ